MKSIVCLPTYNEIESIELMIGKIRSVGLEVFVSDAGSTDGTIEKAKELNVEVFPRKGGNGKGVGLRNGIEIAKQKGYQGIIFTDCDNTYPVEPIPAMAIDLDNYDMIVGVRDFKQISFLRRLANYIMTGSINILFLSNFKDCASGLRAIRIDTFENILDANYFNIELQMSSIAAREKFKVKEIPIAYAARLGESKIGLKHLFIILYAIFRERFRRLS